MELYSQDELAYMWLTNDPRLYELNSENKLRLINHLLKERVRKEKEQYGVVKKLEAKENE